MSGNEPSQAAGAGCACETKKCKCGFFRGLLFFVVIAAVGATVFLQIKWGEPFKTAHQKVLADAAVKEALGEPISMTQVIPGGSAADNMFWGIKGPKGRAAVESKARFVDGKWEYVLLNVVLADSGKRISIAVDGGNDAAPFDATPAGTNADSKEKKEVAPPQLNFDVGDAEK